MSAPEPYAPTLLNAWRSPRLIYRAIEDNPVDRQTLWAFADNDPVSIAMVSMRPLSPQPSAAVQRFYERLHLLYIRVFICLPPTEEEIAQWEGLIAEKAEKSGLTATLDVEKLKGEFPRPEAKPIGVLTLLAPSEEGLHHRNAMIGIGLTTGYRGQGYGGEATNWVLDWGFMRLGLHRIWLAAFGYNERAVKLYKKLGFVEEGREREAVLYERQWWDIVRLGMLEGEWEALRKKQAEENEAEGEKKKEE
ncbi:acyl-CoA N-acyltransferase [Copromyces sp. CBS 386.78]|nr:acyl-CoA N-acyltransferase [Copromyces sp. CBS 386.78]